MKLDPRRVAGFLRDPGSCRVVLLHGDDEGLIRERAASLVRAVAGSLDDPFRVADLDAGSAGRLAEEAQAGSLLGGRRAVRVRDATDALAKAVQALLSAPGDTLIVLEGPGITARSKLRGLLETAADAAVVACYAEQGRDLAETVRAGAMAAGVSIEPAALAWLVGQLGADRGSTRQEIEKLALFAGPAGVIGMDAARACVGDLAGLSLDDALFAATLGDVPATDRALELALSEGAAPVAVLRAGLIHLHRLHRAAEQVAAGQSAAEAAKSVRPPVFFRRVGDFARSLGFWTVGPLTAAAGALSEAERACKRTGAPDVLICRHAILTLARRGQAAAEA